MATTARPSAPVRVAPSSEVQKVLDLIKQKNIQVVDVKFCDLPGTWQHFSIPAATLNEAMIREG
ncbi:MAG: glutamine synthetase, partial [Gemmatimonadota bacterium]|nr:glutamine synthetase [Gemmatimonadota bacterium]